MELGQFSSGLKLVDAALEMAPDIPDFLDIKAECHNNLNNPHEALPASSRATQIEPLMATGWIQQSWANVTLGNNSEALRCAKKAIKFDRQNDMGWNNAAVALFSLDRFDEAKRYADRAVELNPHNTKAQMTLQAISSKTSS